MGQVVHAAPAFGAQPERTARTGIVARVLIVAADPASLMTIEQTLRSEGYSTATAFDAAGATAAADRTGPFELLITDLRMTPVNGVELARALRAQEPELQVLYVTTCRDELFARDIPHTADDDVIEKPFSEEELLDAVAALLYWHRRPRRTT